MEYFDVLTAPDDDAVSNPSNLPHAAGIGAATVQVYTLSYWDHLPGASPLDADLTSEHSSLP